MKKKIISLTLSILFIVSLVVLLVPQAALADANSMLWGGFRDDFQQATGLGSTDVRVMIAGLVRIFLGFLGIAAVILIMVAGFKWMISGGDEEKVGQAKGMLASSAVGIVIILFSFGLAQFFLNNLHSATGAGSAG